MNINKIHTPLLRTYLELTKELDITPIYNIWCFISGFGAACSRHIWFNSGDTKIYANNYIFLVSNNAQEKTQAMGLIKSLVADASPDIKLGADQFNGNLTAFTKDLMSNYKADNTVKDLTDVVFGVNTTDLSFDIDDANNSIYCIQQDISSFYGKTDALAILLLDLYHNPETYIQLVGKVRTRIVEPCINFLSGASTETINNYLPKVWSSRNGLANTVLVAGFKTNTIYSRPKALDMVLKQKIIKALAHVKNKLTGALYETPEAREYIDEIYKYKAPYSDSRLINFQLQRYQHYIKILIALTVSTGSNKITLELAKDAQFILVDTEKTMESALGEYGLEPFAVKKNKVVDILKQHNGFIERSTLLDLTRKDISTKEFSSIVGELLQSKVMERHFRTDSKNLTPVECYIYNFGLDAVSSLIEKGKQKGIAYKKDDNIIVTQGYNYAN